MRDRDDAAGTLTLTFGHIVPQNSATLLVRFRALMPAAETVLHLDREDGHDRANPLFLTLGATLDGPLLLDVSQTDKLLVVRGRGYKPGEPVVVWGNMRDGRTVPITPGTWAAEDTIGSVEVRIGPLDASITSLVVGQISSVTSTAQIVPPSSNR